ncbi:MAG: hypothetical protein H3C59_12810 [Burkholderiaceae bacterium]|nr:hypothetical protein [Burkholderiaceae bacterium]
MRYFAALAIAALVLFQAAHAGVTIHFKGSAADGASVDEILEKACEIAQSSQ